MPHDPTSFLQEVQVHGLPAAYKVVLGLVGKICQSIVLPACAVNKIRETFPSDTYTGFNFPPPIIVIKFYCTSKL